MSFGLQNQARTTEKTPLEQNIWDSSQFLPPLLEKAKLVREISDGKNEIPHKFLGCKI